MSGLLWSIKGHTGRSTLSGYVSTKSPIAVYHNLGARLDEPHLKWVWTPNRVSVERADGAVLQSRDHPREKLLENASLKAPWDDLDLLYFRGYALWNYLMAPFYFTWPGFSTREVESHKEAGQTWRVLEVTYPDGFSTHCKVQKYYYDNQYHLRRLDYVADVLNAGVAAHYCYDEEKIDGVLFPMLRRAIGIRDGQAALSAPSTVLLNFHRIVVRDEKGPNL